MTTTTEALSWTLFATTRGNCGVAWNDRGIVALQLPEETDAETERRVLEKAEGATRDEPPPWLRTAIAKIARQVDGKAEDLTGIPLDTSALPAFHRKVYELLRMIPSGETVTYGELATKLGSRNASRAVGQAMARNPFPIVVPCHRVLAAGQKPGGFSAFGGWETKKALLAGEGVQL